MNARTHYCCPEVDCSHARLLEHEDGLCCPNGHFFPYIQGLRVPIFACEAENMNEYALEDAAKIHDNALRWVFDTFGTDEPSLRRSLVSRLHLSKGQMILVTGTGSGNDLPYLAQSLEGTGVIYAQDISTQMLMAAVDRYSAQ